MNDNNPASAKFYMNYVAKLQRRARNRLCAALLFRLYILADGIKAAGTTETALRS